MIRIDWKLLAYVLICLILLPFVLLVYVISNARAMKYIEMLDKKILKSLNLE